MEIIERDAWSTRRAGSGVTAPRPATARWLLAAFIVAAWTLPGLLYSVQIYGVGRASDPNLSFFRAALHALPSWWIWIVLTPLVARIARLVPIGRCQGPRAVAVHLAASLAVGLVVLGFAALWFSLTPIRGERDRSFVEWLWTLTHATTLEGYVFSYWLIVGAVHVIGDERRLRAHEIADARRDALVARSRMQVLARQLQPHFLFNSLNALSTLILKRDTDAALGMLSSLAQFLRTTIRVGDVDIQPLRDELDLVSQYLDVEKARLGHRLAVVIDAEDAAGDVPVPVLILQPLVENAVRHGIAAREQGGEIAIRATLSGDVLHVEVVNDGPGLSRDWRERAEERVGLKNTRSRLREAYGGAARLTVEDAGSGRTRLVIELPARCAPTKSWLDAAATAPGADSPAAVPRPAPRIPSEPSVAVPQPGRPSSPVAIPLVFAAWTLPALLYSVQLYEIGRHTDPTFTFGPALLVALAAWWLWIPLTPLIGRLARRLPIRRRRLAGRLAAHLAISLCVGLAALALQSLWMSVAPRIPGIALDFRSSLHSSLLSTSFHLNVFSYWLIVGAVHVIDDERRLQAHEIADARRDALVARSRMQVLARQLQPHFLFNSLNALSTLILKRDTDAALGMLSSLAQFLRATIRVGDVDVQPLRDELDLVSQYLDVEKARLGDRLAVVIDAEDAAGDVPVPVLILQPLVENAVRHGIAAREQGGEIAIQGTRSGDVLRVELVNDGPGLTDDWRERAEERVGLKNTRSRLREAYGGAARLTVEDAGSGRTRVVIEVPARGQPGEVTT